VFVWPVPTAEQINRHWQNVSYADLNQNTTYQENKRRLEMNLIARIRELAPGKRVLDYGCSFGNLMCRAHDEGFHVEGLDPNPMTKQFLSERGFCVHHA
jgi:2-polyprenyl-3-methyl-5-hydroxy-6-metoxy-1,4-benzoquinol methylase